jgi:predicted nuclease of restriction endonuclease-like (RecB) superfamily
MRPYPMNEIIPTDDSGLLGEIRERIRAAQYEALRAVNRELIGLYWDIGRLIVERQAGDSWGRAVVETLARDLQAEFPGLQGLSARNIWYMRDFYSAYRDNEILQLLVAEIGWTHNLVILTKCKHDAEREFYLRMTRAHGWTKYALRESNKPIGVASYRVVSTLPRELEGEIPAPEQVAKLLEGVEE